MTPINNTPLRGKKILVITPSFPWPESGAEQSDRASGIRQLCRLGATVVVVAKVVPWADPAYIQEKSRELGIRTRTVPYRSLLKKTLAQKLLLLLGRLRHPYYLDGATYEYADPAIQTVVAEELDTWRPDLVWFDYTYLWPLYGLVAKRGVPIITRSINYEPEHFIEEDGRSVITYLKYIPKWLVERAVIHASTVVFAITPKEEKIYRGMGAPRVATLPLRGIYPYLQQPHMEYMAEKIEVVFSGSTYSVSHNRAAAEMLIMHIAPMTEKAYPGVFRFNITGGKLPTELKDNLPAHVRYHGYVEHLDALYAQMHIAVVPSLFGAGMQQKIFEPLCRGLAVVTSGRGLAQYPFMHDTQVLTADSAKQYVEALGVLRDPRVRAQIAKAGREVARDIFSQEAIDTTVAKAICAIL